MTLHKYSFKLATGHLHFCLERGRDAGSPLNAYLVSLTKLFTGKNVFFYVLHLLNSTLTVSVCGEEPGRFLRHCAEPGIC